ncbi:3',5'-cyclic-nucleotide phosphodiesterase pde1 [Marasmius tenuissimus]|uniref:3',5'-cyclic-nucleotide phosphodiesterase pde1 n=1 Tax=Marasmius tenuissimus TaxID=585030 RepID=A0ABR3ADJ1_9AGAR
MSLPAIFDLVVVGAGGGPDETNLSSYLLKRTGTAWEDGIIAVEAGSGPGALSRLLLQNPKLFEESYSAADIYSFVRCYLLSHAHLDHINGLVISAGSLSGPRKRVYSVKKALQDLETVFSDRIWPNLASWDEDDEEYKLLYSILSTNGRYQTILPDISVQTMPLNHGSNQSGAYESAAFIIRDDTSEREFVSSIPHKLSTIFIECSWPSGRSDDSLYGHLSPEHLKNELVALATEVYTLKNGMKTGKSLRPQRKRQKRNPIAVGELKGVLGGLRVYIIHVKDELKRVKPENCPMREVILEQVKSLVDPLELGVEILIAAPGMHIRI